MSDQYYTNEVRLLNKRSLQNAGLPQLGANRHFGQAEANTRGGSSASGRPYGTKAFTGGVRSVNSREGPHEAHRRIVQSLQKQQMMDAGSHAQEQQRDSSFELG